MNPPTDSVESVAPRPAWALWAICVLVGSTVLLTWAAGRVKPLMIYPLLVGGVLGVWARIAGSFCHVSRHQWWMLLPTVCAIVVTIGGLVVASQRRAMDIKPVNPLAEKLLRQFEQQTPSDSPAPRITSPFWSYLHDRYHGITAVRTGMWLAGELLVAVIACLGVMKLFAPARPA